MVRWWCESFRRQRGVVQESCAVACGFVFARRCLVDGARWLLGWCEASGAADGGDCRGGGSRDSEGGRYSVCLAEVLGGNLLAF